MSDRVTYKWWRCPICGFHGCRKEVAEAADDLKRHMLDFHDQWIIDSVARAALTDAPQTAGSTMELEPTNLPAEVKP